MLSSEVIEKSRFARERRAEDMKQREVDRLRRVAEIKKIEEKEKKYYCFECDIELDRVRDGEEKENFRCSSCYWDDKYR